MASFLSRLFGSGSGDKEKPAERSDPVSYEGLTIRAAPEKAGDQWRLVGVIIKQGEEGEMERVFLRADTFPSREEAESFAIRKGKQIIDEQGDKLFADGAATGRA